MDDNKMKTDELVKAIGPRIQYARKQKGLSLKDVAKKTGFTKSYLSQIENMKREPPVSTLSKIAYVLEVDLTFLINGGMQNLEVPNLTIVRKGEGKAYYGPHGEKGRGPDAALAYSRGSGWRGQRMPAYGDPGSG